MGRIALLWAALGVACWTGARATARQEPAIVEAHPAPVPSRAPTVVGRWSETWGVAGQTDVTYHDIYELAMVDGQLAASSPGRPYEFRRVAFDGSHLLVDLDNGGVTIAYDLVLDPGGAQLAGRAKTNQGVDVPVVWDRQ